MTGESLGDGSGAGVHIEFRENVVNVNLDCPPRYRKSRANLAVRHPHCDEAKNFEFSACEPNRASTNSGARSRSGNSFAKLFHAITSALSCTAARLMNRAAFSKLSRLSSLRVV